MGGISKSFALILILTIVISSLSLMIAKPANAQTIPTPSVPKFTVKFVLASNSITTIDPYTGQSTTKQYQNNTVQLVIKNQPFLPPDDLTGFDYNVRYKGHSEENWTEVFTGSSGENRLYSVQNISSENTLMSLYQTENQADLKYGFGFIDIQGYSQVDFQVEAITDTFHPFAPHSDIGTWTYITSGWSPTQTVTIPAPTASPTQSVPELSWFLVLPLLLSVFCVAVIFRHRKQVKKL